MMHATALKLQSLQQQILDLRSVMHHDSVKWTDVALFLSTLALAAVTIRLVRATLDLAADTVASTALADLHHLEMLMPILTFEGTVGVEQQGVGQAFLDEAARICIRGIIINAGGGPALSCEMRIEIQGKETNPIYLGPFGPSPAARPINRIVKVPWFAHQQLNITLREFPPYTMTLRYCSQFDDGANPGSTTEQSFEGGENAVAGVTVRYYKPALTSRVEQRDRSLPWWQYLLFWKN